MFSRFDGADVDPFANSIDVVFHGGENIPPLDLLLYNTTGVSVTDLHYDPVVIRERGRATKRQGQKSDLPRKAVGGASGSRKARRTDVNGDGDPHEGVPTFMRITPNNSFQKAGLSCSGGAVGLSPQANSAFTAARRSE